LLTSFHPQENHKIAIMNTWAYITDGHVARVNLFIGY